MNAETPIRPGEPAAEILEVTTSDWTIFEELLGVEGYPVEPNGGINPDDLYHGALGCFLQAGFRRVERRCTRRALVRLRLDASGKA